MDKSIKFLSLISPINQKINYCMSHFFIGKIIKMDTIDELSEGNDTCDEFKDNINKQDPDKGIDQFSS